MGGMRGGGGMGGMGCMGGGGGGGGGTDGQAQCSVHGRKRTMRNLEDDGMGGFKCTPQGQCQNTGGPEPGSMPINPANMMGGDWLCPQCGDHQFARNSNCRKCGADKPPAGDDRVTPY